MKKLMFTLAAVSCAGLAQADDGTFMNAAGGAWSDKNNWKDGVIASGAGAIATISAELAGNATIVLPEEGLTDQERTVMRDFVVQMNVAYFSGKLKSKEEYESEEGYRLWKEKAPGSSSFQFIESIVQGERRDHTFIEEI